MPKIYCEIKTKLAFDLAQSELSIRNGKKLNQDETLAELLKDFIPKLTPSADTNTLCAVSEA